MEAILETVKMGNEAAFQRLYHESPIGSVGRISLNDLRQVKYAFILFITKMNRAAIEGGVPSNYIFHQSDCYCQRMDAMNSAAEISQLKLKVGLNYCREVTRYSGYNKYSLATKKCCEYIREHLYEKISIGNLSAAVALNRRSLSIYFKRDTGKTILDYINARRLEEARILLKNTGQSISWISEVLQYSTQSYFGKKYKQFFGVTPKGDQGFIR
jgi:AraC-like DNA-binding protein